MVANLEELEAPQAVSNLHGSPKCWASCPTEREQLSIYLGRHQSHTTQTRVTGSMARMLRPRKGNIRRERAACNVRLPTQRVRFRQGWSRDGDSIRTALSACCHCGEPQRRLEHASFVGSGRTSSASTAISSADVSRPRLTCLISGIFVQCVPACISFGLALLCLASLSPSNLMDFSAGVTTSARRHSVLPNISQRVDLD